MKTFAVEFSATAGRHVHAIAAWWETNRPAAPDLFQEELAGAVEQMTRAPHSGWPYPAPRPTGTRRLLLRRTGYHVYFTIDDQRARVTVRAVWHAARGRAPRLS